ncbi:MAG: efflux RND transporter periplasmic adaptor subunit [Bacteroidales bacterium]|jgi:HlyD family secretion protein|nr:efflux RND transporter periplasmic adaptor subunit [Bacteroidales bacterium]MDD3527891.1 efflux RND transporter periplasmic adaptor subunit [Bacteroidales bacterium]MDY0335904.1 efflux RND transporter periplasmic adaptor subunit [Bacteroidales bacterium]NLO49617.1 efflux RND transporter periplasmic adaptor subunit [Bacteroidales bacterium]
MDIPKVKKKGFKKKHLLIVLGALLIAFLVYQAFFAVHLSTLNVDAEKVQIETVSEGIFHNYITVTGNVEPIATIFLDAREGGRVEEKVIEEGAMVSKGDVILRLSNPDLTLSILNSESQLAEKSNFLRNTMVVMEQEKLQIKRELLNLEFDIKRKKRVYGQKQVLFQDELISKEEFLMAEEDYQFAQRSYELYMERQRQDSIYRKIQVDQMEDNLRNMEMNLKLIRQSQDNLNVTAPVDGQLTTLEVELGQSVPKGGRIGQIHVLSSYKVVAKIDEHYIDQVRTGLMATLDRQGQEYQLKIRKILPEVRDGRFSVELVFTGERPDNMRTGQTYYTRLQLGSPEAAILLPRGNFFQQTGGQWIFVLSPDGKFAERRMIKIGRQNPMYYEVLEGLKPGEKVIVSGYENFGDNQRIVLR